MQQEFLFRTLLSIYQRRCRRSDLPQVVKKAVEKVAEKGPVQLMHSCDWSAWAARQRYRSAVCLYHYST